MMQRVPEPELMNDPAQAAAYASADCSVAHDAFVTHLRGRFPDHSPKQLVDLGCGTGDITLRLARAFPAARITGIDAAPAMLALAGSAAIAYGDRLRFVPSRLSDYRPATRYDTLVSNSLLHHLDDPRELWQALGRLGLSGAVVFVMDLRRPPTATVARELVDLYARGEAETFRRDFYASLLAAYEPSEIKAQLTAAELDLQVEPVGDRHVMVWGHVA